MKPSFNPLKNQKGMALLVAIFSTMFLMMIAQDVAQEARIEFEVSAQGVKKIQAYYAAKAGVEMGLLKILLYKKAQHTIGDKLGSNKSLLDLIWNMPYAWPPTIPGNLAMVDKGLMTKAIKESYMKTQYMVSITPEGGKIDINDLGSSSETLVNATRTQLFNIFKDKLDHDEDFQEQYTESDIDDLINSLKDWVDRDKSKNSGGDEASDYREFDSDSIPPNSEFKTLEELRMVHGMTDDLFDILKTRVTVYGTKGIQVNKASKDVLKSIDPQINDEVVEAITKHIQDAKKGPFADLSEFESFLDNEGVYLEEFNPNHIPLLFGQELNFRITSQGIVGNLIKKIEVVTYDVDNLKENLIKALDKEDTENKPITQNPNPPPTSTSTNPPKNTTKKKKKAPSPKGRPIIIYWNET